VLVKEKGYCLRLKKSITFLAGPELPAWSKEVDVFEIDPPCSPCGLRFLLRSPSIAGLLAGGLRDGLTGGLRLLSLLCLLSGGLRGLLSDGLRGGLTSGLRLLLLSVGVRPEE
jgi:hypothetical protein